MNDISVPGAAPQFAWLLPCLPTVLCGGLLVVFLAFYVPIPFTDTVYDAHRLGVSMALTLLLFGSFPSASRLVLAVVAALIALGAYALLDAPKPIEGVAVMAAHLALLLVGWRIVLSARLHFSWVTRSWQVVAVGAALVYAVRTGAAIVAGMQADHVLLREVFLGFANRRHFAQLTPLLLPVIASAAFSLDAYRHRAWRLAAWAALTAWWILVWLNGSSSAFYAIWIGLGTALAIAGWRRARGLVWATVLAFIVALAVIYLLDAFTPLLYGVLESTAPGLSGRDELWSRALVLMAASPWTGYGPGQFPYLVSIGPGHPHNLLLAFGLDYGLIGLGLLGVLFWRWFSPVCLTREIRTLSDANAQWPTALTAAAFGGLAHAMVSGVTVMPLAQLTLVVTLGLLAGSRTAAPAPARNSNMAIRAGSTIVAVALLTSVAISLPRTCGYAQQEAVCRYSPAFWGHYPATRRAQ